MPSGTLKWASNVMPVICVEQFGQFIAISIQVKANTEAGAPRVTSDPELVFLY